MKFIKKITDSEQNFIKSILENDNGLKITAVVIAIFMFISVNQLGNPIWKNYFGDTDYIEGVPLTVKYDSDQYVVSGLPQNINVNISGSENSVQKTLNEKDNLVATLPLSYKGTGSYTISSNQLEFNNTANVQITPATSNFEVTIQEKTEETRSVDIGYINGNNRTQGIMLNQPNLEQKTVQVTGGINDVSNVVSIRGQIDLNQLSETSNEENTDVLPVDLVPYNKDGEVVSGVSISPNKINVNQTYTKGSVSLPVQFEYNNDDNNYVNAICKSTVDKCDEINEIKVNVYGEKNKIESLKNVTFKIDKNTFNSETSIVQVTPNLESGVFVEKSAPTEIKLGTELGISKEIKGVEVKVANLDDDLKITNDLETSVTVIGREKEVEKLKADDIKITVDASEVKDPGTYELKYQVVNGEKYNVKTKSDTMSLQVEKKE